MKQKIKNQPSKKLTEAIKFRDEAKELFDSVLWKSLPDKFQEIDDAFKQVKGQFAKIDLKFYTIKKEDATINDRFAKIAKELKAINNKFTSIDKTFAKVNQPMNEELIKIDEFIERKLSLVIGWLLLLTIGLIAIFFKS